MKFNELGRSFFRKMVQIRRYFVTTCTIRSTRGAKLPIDATFSESLEKSLDKVVSREEKNFSVHKKYMNFFQYRKTALDETYTNFPPAEVWLKCSACWQLSVCFPSVPSPDILRL